MTSDCPTRTCRLQAWDEENRLTTVNDKNKSYLSNYLYDAGGERIIKLSGAIQKITQQNGDIIEFANLGENISINFGAHMVLNIKRSVNYSSNSWIKGVNNILKILNPMMGNHDYTNPKIYNSWGEYTGSNNLINKFIKQYGTK